ncbi:ABC transporter substrate-binding protein [Pararhodospirillum photometricum]|nr:ABC transporter substrate-binding protein [Pararhodospirillum photometricum]
MSSSLSRRSFLALAALTPALLSARPGRAAPVQPLTVLLDWFINPDHGPLVIARQLGYFRDVGLDVTLVAPSDPNDPPKLVAAGQADVAIGYQPQLHLQVAEGLPLLRFGSLIDTPLNCVVALRDGPIKSMADLKGRKVGYSVAGFEDVLLGTMLRHAGVNPSDVEKINVNFSLSPAVISGQVDAVIGPFRNFELNQMDLAGHPGVAFLPEDHGVPSYDELIFLANATRHDDPKLQAFLEGVERGVMAILNHPEDTWEVFRRAAPDLDDALNRRAWADTVRRFAAAPAALAPSRYQRFAEYLKGEGLIDTVPPVERYVLTLKG